MDGTVKLCHFLSRYGIFMTCGGGGECIALNGVESKYLSKHKMNPGKFSVFTSQPRQQSLLMFANKTYTVMNLYVPVKKALH